MRMPGRSMGWWLPWCPIEYAEKVIEKERFVLGLMAVTGCTLEEARKVDKQLQSEAAAKLEYVLKDLRMDATEFAERHGYLNR